MSVTHPGSLSASLFIACLFSPVRVLWNPETFGKVVITVCPTLTTFTKKKNKIKKDKNALVTIWLLFNIKCLFACLPATWILQLSSETASYLPMKTRSSRVATHSPRLWVVGYTLSPCLVSRVMKTVQNTCSVVAVLQIPAALRQEQNFHFSAQ